MNRYEFEVTLKVHVDAFDEADAIDAIHDAFGEGSTCGVDIESFKVDSGQNERLQPNQD